MPRLFNDVLLIIKEQRITAAEKREAQEAQFVARDCWYKGLGAGVFVVLLAFSGLSYLNLVNNEKLATIAFGMALAGGALALIYRTKRS